MSGAEEHTALRVQPLDETYRELSRKYLLPISFEQNNMFIVDWSEEDFGDLNFYDMYDILYPKVNVSMFLMLQMTICQSVQFIGFQKRNLKALL